MSTTRLVVGALILGSAVAIASACGSSNKSGSGGSGGSGGQAGSAGSSGSGGAKEAGPTDSGQKSDVNFDAPFKLPEGGCGQIFCPAAVAASCFQSLNDCSNACNQIAQSNCDKQWNAVLTCLGPSPQLTCTDAGKISTKNCNSQVQAMTACLHSG